MYMILVEEGALALSAEREHYRSISGASPLSLSKMKDKSWTSRRRRVECGNGVARGNAAWVRDRFDNFLETATRDRESTFPNSNIDPFPEIRGHVRETPKLQHLPIDRALVTICPLQHIPFDRPNSHNGRRRKDTIPQTRLVTGRWLVRPAEELESQHCDLRPDNSRLDRSAMEDQCSKRTMAPHPRAGQIRAESVVSPPWRAQATEC